MSNFFTRWVPHPILSLVILGTWLLMWGVYTLGLFLLGLIVALAVPVFVRRFWPDAPKVTSYATLFVYIAVFLWDVIAANLNVAVLVLKPNTSIKPTFLEIPLDIEHPFLIMVLANTISLTPGTVSSNVAGDRSKLLVHCLDCEDPDREIERIKERYEDRLEEVFG